MGSIPIVASSCDRVLYVAPCKAVHAGSIPAAASNELRKLGEAPRQARRCAYLMLELDDALLRSVGEVSVGLL
jgi:hypothetical protein